MTEPDLHAAFALRTPEDCLRLYRDWAESYDAGFAAEMDERRNRGANNGKSEVVHCLSDIDSELDDELYEQPHHGDFNGEKEVQPPPPPR